MNHNKFGLIYRKFGVIFYILVIFDSCIYFFYCFLSLLVFCNVSFCYAVCIICNVLKPIKRISCCITYELTFLCIFNKKKLFVA